MANLQQIERHLKKLKLSYTVIDLGDEIFTVRGVVETGVDEDEIVKTLIIRTQQNLRRSQHKVKFIALAVRGKDRLDFKKVRKLFGSKSELAKPAEISKVCGVSVGAICPILLDIPVIFDNKVMKLKHVNMGSGDLTKGLEMDFGDLLKAIGDYQVDDLV